MNSYRPSALQRYRPSGKVDAGRFLPWAVLTLAAGAVSAYLLHLAYEHGYYYVLIMPITAAFYLAGLILVSVRQGHCRSRAAAVALGLAVAAVLYPGQLLLSMRAATGTLDPAVLPAYVAWRMSNQELDPSAPPETTENEDDGETEARPAAPPSGLEVALNWTILAAELGLVVFFCLPFGLVRVTREPYCESCGRWARREVLAFPSDRGPELLAAIAAGAFAAKAREIARPHHPNVPALLAAVDLCPTATGAIAAWVSLRFEKGSMGMLGPFHPIETLTSRFLARAVKLEPRDAAAVAELLPSRDASASARAPRPMRAVPRSEEDAAGTARDAVARIEAVEASRAGRILTPRNAILAQACALVYLVAAAAVVTVFIGGLNLLKHDAWMVVGAVVTAVGGLLGAGLLAALLRHPEYAAQRFLHRLVRLEIARRPSPIVRADDSEAFLVELVPRENWSRPMVDEAADVGLLKVDFKRRELRFEGDRERYVIPAAAVQGIGLDGYEIRGATAKQFAVLHVAAGGGVAELPLARRFTPFWEGVRRGHRRCGTELFERIVELLSATAGRTIRTAG